MNLVELGLEHLGVDAGKAGPDVQSVVRACGESAYEHHRIIQYAETISPSVVYIVGLPLTSRQGSHFGCSP